MSTTDNNGKQGKTPEFFNTASSTKLTQNNCTPPCSFANPSISNAARVTKWSCPAAYASWQPIWSMRNAVERATAAPHRSLLLRWAAKRFTFAMHSVPQSKKMPRKHSPEGNRRLNGRMYGRERRNEIHIEWITSRKKQIANKPKFATDIGENGNVNQLPSRNLRSPFGTYQKDFCLWWPEPSNKWWLWWHNFEKDFEKI